MGTKTSIEWTRGEDGTAGATWTPIRARNLKTGKVGWFCEHATTGCEFCYAESMNKRLGTGLAFKPGHRKDVEIFLDGDMLLAPLKWKKPKKVFVCSMTDLFADFVPDIFIDKMFAVMALSPHHIFQVLTKRSARMQSYCSGLKDRAVEVAQTAVWLGIWDDPDAVACDTVAAIDNGSPPNVWIGISAERQQEWDDRKGHLAATPAAIRFASFEPLLAPIIEPRPMSDFIQWAIVGSESGRSARPCDIEWVRSLRDQCTSAGTKFFWKQHAKNGHKIPVPKLDGRQWMEFPVGA